MKILNTIFKVLSWIITIAVAVCVVFLLVLPLGFKVKPYVVQSGSMEPVIQTGGLVWIDTKDKDVQVGDVVGYKVADDTYVTHRIISEEDGLYITKGDANEAQDLKPVHPEQIMGSVAHIGPYLLTIPYAGYFLSTIQSKPIITVPIVAFLLCIMLVSSALEEAVLEKKKARHAKS